MITFAGPSRTICYGGPTSNAAGSRKGYILITKVSMNGLRSNSIRATVPPSTLPLIKASPSSSVGYPPPPISRTCGDRRRSGMPQFFPPLPQESQIQVWKKTVLNIWGQNGVWKIYGPPPPSAHLRLILREHKIIPATKESYRVYVGTGKKIPTVTPFNLVNMPRLLSPFLTELLQGSMRLPSKRAQQSWHIEQVVGHGFC